MAAGFWYLEDGRCFSRHWSWMNYMLELISDEVRSLQGAEEFYNYLAGLIMTKYDEYNGFGGFFPNGNKVKSIMFIIDLREFTQANRDYFWTATQNALTQLIMTKNPSNEDIISLLTMLLDMHKRIKRSEDPQSHNHLIRPEPSTGNKKGPGW